jgi:hypothetical protein
MYLCLIYEMNEQSFKEYVTKWSILVCKRLNSYVSYFYERERERERERAAAAAAAVWLSA